MLSRTIWQAPLMCPSTLFYCTVILHCPFVLSCPTVPSCCFILYILLHWPTSMSTVLVYCLTTLSYFTGPSYFLHCLTPLSYWTVTVLLHCSSEHSYWKVLLYSPPVMSYCTALLCCYIVHYTTLFKFHKNKIFIQLFIQYFLCMNMTIKWESLLGFLKVGSIHSY